MWTPHFAFDVNAVEGDRSIEDLRKSFDDEVDRKFYVQFFLDDIRLRRKEAQLVAPDDANSVSFSDPPGKPVKARLCYNEQGKLNSIVCDVINKTPIQAVWHCFNRLSYLLSYWSLANGGSQCIYGARVKDVVHDVVWRSFPDLGVESNRPVPVFIPPSLDFTPTHKKLLSLYREARNSVSPYYTLLCAFKIMEFMLKNKLSAETDKAVRNSYIDNKRERGVVTKDMLVLARAHQMYAHYEGMKFGKFIESIRDVRNKIAHAITKGEIYDFDNFHHFVDVSVLASLADLVAREMLVEEFRLLDLIAKAGTTADSVQPYVDNSNFSFLKIMPVNGDDLNERYLDTRD